MDESGKAAMQYVLKIFDGITGGAFSRGWREPTVPERIQEWDGLPPEMMQTLRDRMGDEWVLKQGAEIEKLRRQTDTGATNAVAV